MTIEEQPVIGWAEIHRRLCMATDAKGRPLQIWSLRLVQSLAGDLERAGAITRKVVEFPDGVRRRTVLCWREKFLDYMIPWTSAREAQRREARRLRKAGRV